MRGAGCTALGALLLAALAGCSAPAAPPAPSPAASRPPFPAVPGRVVATSEPDGEWLVRIAVRDAEAAYRDARQRLVDGGFQLTKDREGTGGGDGQACRPDLCVGFAATVDPAGRATVAYEVFHPLGITTDG